MRGSTWIFCAESPKFLVTPLGLEPVSLVIIRSRLQWFEHGEHKDSADCDVSCWRLMEPWGNPREIPRCPVMSKGKSTVGCLEIS